MLFCTLFLTSITKTINLFIQKLFVYVSIIVIRCVRVRAKRDDMGSDDSTDIRARQRCAADARRSCVQGSVAKGQSRYVERAARQLQDDAVLDDRVHAQLELVKESADDDHVDGAGDRTCGERRVVFAHRARLARRQQPYESDLSVPGSGVSDNGANGSDYDDHNGRDNGERNDRRDAITNNAATNDVGNNNDAERNISRCMW